VAGKFATVKVGLMIVAQGIWQTDRLAGRWTGNSRLEMDAVDDGVCSHGRHVRFTTKCLIHISVPPFWRMSNLFPSFIDVVSLRNLVGAERRFANYTGLQEFGFVDVHLVLRCDVH
jgi:hypothetical protein